jgi:hypothetical protein
LYENTFWVTVFPEGNGIFLAMKKGVVVTKKFEPQTFPFFCKKIGKRRERKMRERSKVTKMVTIAMLSAISYVLMLFQFPLLPAAPFLQVDFGDIPALIGGIIFGPVTGVIIVLFRNM